jgi:hypothetical protein
MDDDGGSCPPQAGAAENAKTEKNDGVGDTRRCFLFRELRYPLEQMR